MTADELLIEEDTPESPERKSMAWRILIVDDDEEVHQGTLFALKNETVIGRPLEFLHAHSAGEARRVLAATQDIAVILLDVVMEKVDAGLELIRVIREELHLSDPRIILRTGQPGYAPETDAIRSYDINDYRTKSELTHTRLLTSITAAVRSYDQIRSLSRQRKGLEMIVDASPALYEQPAIDSFAEGVIIQIGSLLHMEPEGILCVQQCDELGKQCQAMRIIGATGRYRPKLGHLLDELDAPRIRASLDQCLREKKNLYGPDWTALYIHLNPSHEGAVFVDTSQPIEEADRQLLSVFCTNISAGLRNVRLMEELRDMAFYDKLSRLPNRSFFISELDRCMGEEKPDKTVAIVDIDHFSEFNDALGHVNGDRLLWAVGERLKRHLCNKCTVARVSSDNFAVVGPPDSVNPRNIGQLFSDPFQLPDGEMPISVTMGLADLWDVQGDGLDALKATSIALKRAKTAKRGRYEYFTREMESDIRNHLSIYQELRQVLRARGLAVYYQPQTDLATGQVIGVEALVRWRKPDGKFVPPDQFISVAEHTGLILDLGEFVLAESVRQLAEWHRKGHDQLRMAINVSMAQFKSKRFLPFLAQALEQSGVNRQRLELEITESMIMSDVNNVIDMLSAVREMGLSVAIDDFGTGFSSLGHLQRLPIDRLKVDRSFVRDLGSNGRGETIAQMVVQLGKTLGLTIIGEGVETPEQERILRDWGCHEGQGYLWSPALDPAALEDWLSRRRG